MTQLRHGTSTGYMTHGCRCDDCRFWSINNRAERVARGLPEGDKRHGTINGYTNYACRCELCFEASRRYHHEKRKSAREQLGLTRFSVPDPEKTAHGTRAGYVTGKCRCEECKGWEQARRQERKDTVIADDDPRHGTVNLYTNWYCRCARCTRVAKAKRHDRKLKARDANRAPQMDESILPYKEYPDKYSEPEDTPVPTGSAGW